MAEPGAAEVAAKAEAEESSGIGAGGGGGGGGGGRTHVWMVAQVWEATVDVVIQVRVSRACGWSRPFSNAAAHSSIKITAVG